MTCIDSCMGQGSSRPRHAMSDLTIIQVQALLAKGLVTNVSRSPPLLFIPSVRSSLLFAVSTGISSTVTGCDIGRADRIWHPSMQLSTLFSLPGKWPLPPQHVLVTALALFFSTMYTTLRTRLMSRGSATIYNPDNTTHPCPSFPTHQYINIVSSLAQPPDRSGHCCHTLPHCRK